METLLFLCHRIPYPPNKGDKIRSFNFLKNLSRRYKIILAAFVDDPEDLQYQHEVEKYCKEVFLRPIEPRRRKFRSLSGLLSGEALSVAYYRDQVMYRWIQSVAERESISVAWVFSSTMAQYLAALPKNENRHLAEQAELNPQAENKIETNGETNTSTRKKLTVIDYVDVDSEKWAAYGSKHKWPMSYIYGREGRKLLGFETAMAAQADHGLFVTEDEANLFKKLAPEVAEKVGYVENGVDIDYFDPKGRYSNPYRDGQKVLVFTGAMDYWANVEAVSWFVAEILPGIQQREPDTHFYIVGARPAAEVKKLAERHQVYVTGSVVDIRPYIAHATMAVTPLRVARGVQNKVLEAMAMAKPVVATTGAIEGIRLSPELMKLVADQPGTFIDTVVDLLQGDQCQSLGQQGRELVEDRYSWSSCLRPLDALLGFQEQN